LPTTYTLHKNQVLLQPASLHVPDGELVIRIQPAVDQPLNGIPSGTVGEVNLVIEAGKPQLLVSLGENQRKSSSIRTARQAENWRIGW